MHGCSRIVCRAVCLSAGLYDVKRCDHGGKLRYFLQRWSGLAMLVFLLLIAALKYPNCSEDRMAHRVYSKNVSDFILFGSKAAQP